MKRILMVVVMAALLAVPAVPAFADSVLRAHLLDPNGPSLASAPEGGHNYGKCQSHFATQGDPLNVFGEHPAIANPAVNPVVGDSGLVCPAV